MTNFRHNDSNIMEDIISGAATPTTSDFMFVSGPEVRDAIASMPDNKAADCYGLRSKHFKIAGEGTGKMRNADCGMRKIAHV